MLQTNFWKGKIKFQSDVTEIQIAVIHGDHDMDLCSSGQGSSQGFTCLHKNQYLMIV